jgi:hypothetical protein
MRQEVVFETAWREPNELNARRRGRRSKLLGDERLSSATGRSSGCWSASLAVVIQDIAKPPTNGFPFRNIPQHPGIGVIREGHRQKSKVAGRKDFHEIVLRCIHILLVTDELGPVSQSLQSFGCRFSIASGIRPLSDTIIMAVTDEAAPEGGDLIIMESDVIARDGPTRETGEEDG